MSISCPGCDRRFKSGLGLRKHLLQTTQPDCKALLISGSKSTANADTVGTSTESDSSGAEELEDGEPVRSLLISAPMV